MFFKKWIYLSSSLVLLLSVSSLLSAADYRIFKNDAGVELEAEVLSCEAGESATVRRRDGKVFEDVSWSLFSATDRKYLMQWAKDEAKEFSHADLDAEARLVVTVLKGRDDDFNDYGDIDDHVVKFEPRLIIANDEKDRTFTGVQGVLVMIGQGYLKKREYVVLNREEFTLDIPANDEVRWTGRPFKCSYDPDYGGYRYGGYVLVLKNREGQIVFTKSSKTLWERSAASVMKAKFGLGYDRDFANGQALRTTYGLPGRVR